MTWNTVGNLGTWGSEDELYNAPWLKVAEDLVAAYNERATRIGVTTIDDVDMFEPNLNGSAGFFFPRALSLLDQYVYGSLLTKSWYRQETPWIDYTYNGGNFVNYPQSSGGSVPLMTTARILEILDQTEFLRLTSPPDAPFVNVQTYHPIFVAWANQTYKVLNLLRWTHESYGLSDPRVIDMTNTYRRAQSNVSWADAVTQFETSPTISTGGSDRSFHYGEYLGSTWYVQRVYATTATITGIPDDIAHAIESYSYISQGPSGAQYDVFENNDFASVASTLTRIFSDSTPTIIDRHTITINDLDGTKVTVSAPVGQQSRGYYYSIGNAGWFVRTANFHVLKWDVAGGFEYLDD